jgi:CDP-4-dehydro-6-deoxyglucose reductase, E1
MLSLSWKKWKPGDKHLINRIQWDQCELDSILEVLKSDWFGHGSANEELEQKLSEYTGVKYFKLLNSGSSAIAVAVETFIHNKRISRGDKVIHPVTTFPTSISSAIRSGLVPVYLDTKPNTFVIDHNQVEDAIKKYPDIKGAIIPHLLGNIPEMDILRNILKDRFIIEDACDTMGGRVNGSHLGRHGDFIAFSFYGSHHITAAGGGGALGTDSKELADIAKSIIFWGRDFDVNDSYLDRYKYKTLGMNCQMTAIQAAFALKQIDRIDKFVNERAIQYDELMEIFSKYREFIDLPEIYNNMKPSWFAFPLVVKETAPFTRKGLVDHFSKNGVEVRPIMCGNILKQQPFKEVNRVTLNGEHFPVGDAINDRGLFIPCWGMPEDQKSDYYDIIRQFFSKNVHL